MENTSIPYHFVTIKQEHVKKEISDYCNEEDVENNTVDLKCEPVEVPVVNSYVIEIKLENPIHTVTTPLKNYEDRDRSMNICSGFQRKVEDQRYKNKDIDLDEDLYFSDVSVADPDYEPKVIRESNVEVETVFDSDIKEPFEVVTSAQTHVIPSQDLDDSLSILRDDIETDKSFTNSPVNPTNGNLRNPFNTEADPSSKITWEEPIIRRDISDDRINTNKRSRSRKERDECKRLRNLGQRYVTENGKQIAERQIGSLSTCRLRCVERFSYIERKQCFDEYWTLGSRDRRAMYIASLITILPKKTQKTDSRVINRDCYCKYKLVINNEDKPICKECFCKTFGETRGFIDIVIDKKKHSVNGVIPVDTRGHRPSKNKKTLVN